MKTLTSFITSILKQYIPDITEEVIERSIESAKRVDNQIDWNDENQIVMVSNLLGIMDFTIHTAEVIMASDINNN